MHTSTHALVATALLARPGPGHRARNTAAIAGGLVPDLTMYAMLAWSKIAGIPEYTVWSRWYFSPPWQTWIDYAHSVPVYGLILAVGVAVMKASTAAARTGGLLVVFAFAGLSHIALDFPVHRRDAHAHFVPLSDWRFRSPVSYWDPSHYGNLVAPFETVFGLALCIVLWLRFKNVWARGVLVAAALSYAAPALYFG